MALKPTDFLGSLEKGLRVIEAFSAERPRLAIADVAAVTGFDRATARRCLLTLSELGYADYDGKFFRPAPRLLRLGAACLATMPLAQLVQPLLDQLSADVGQSASVSILDDWEIVYVARAALQRLMSISLMPGSRLPAYCASMGRVLLAGRPDAEVRALLVAHPPVRRTQKSVVDPEALMAIIAGVRADGYAINDQEIELGLRSIAAPLFDSRGRIIAAVNIGVAAVDAEPGALKGLYLDKLIELQRTLAPMIV